MRVETTAIYDKVNISDINMNTNESDSNKSVSGCGAQVSLFDKVMNNTEVDKSMWNRQDDSITSYEEQIKAKVQVVKDNLKALYNKLSFGDYSALSEDGVDINNMETKDIVTVVDRIKIMLAAYCDDYNPGNTDIDVEDIKNVLGTSVNVYKVAEKMQAADIPLTEDNFNESCQGYEMYHKIGKVTKDAAAYMINNNLEPTIRNVYVAESCTAGTSTEHIDKELFNSLKDQIEKIITEAGFPGDKNVLKDAAWMLEKEIPITPENIKLFESYMNIDLNMNDDILLENIVLTVADGKKGTDLNLISQDNDIKKIAEAVKTLDKAGEAEVIDLLSKDREITIENLRYVLNQNGTENQSQNNEDNNESGNKDANNSEYKNKAKQYLAFIQETRALMTSKAGLILAKTGVDIDIMEISELAEQLKEIEKDYFNKNVYTNNPVTDEEMDLYTETNTAVYNMQTAPAAILGNVLTGDVSYNIEEISKNGAAQQIDMIKAGKAYETLSTEIRKDLGDSLNKAVNNSAADILSQLGYEDTADNRRAVKILAFNNMDVTAANIDKIRSMDLEVNALMREMTPETVMEIIKRGFNPLTTDIEELQVMAEELNTSEEESVKFSTYLYKLDKEKSISDKDREKYIGIYKAFNAFKKTDGKVIGSLLKEDAPLTLGNLVSAYKTIYSGGIDVNVDNNFGANENTENGKYFKQLFKESSGMLENKDLSQVTDQNELKEKYNVKDIEDMPVEKFKDILEQAAADTEYLKEAYEEQHQVFERIKDIEGSVMRQLTLYDIPVTVNSLISVYAINEEAARYYKNIKDRFNKEKNDQIAQDMDDILESIDSKDDLQDAYETLDRDVSAYMNKIINSQDMDVTTVDIKSLKLINNGISIMNQWSRNENYVIPYESENGDVGAINLKVVRDRENGGKVTVDMKSADIGHVNAYCFADDTKMSLYIMCDSADLMNSVDKNLEKIKEQTFELGFTECSVKSSCKGVVPEINHAEKSNQKVATNKLYKVAKVIVSNLIEAAGNVNVQ